MVVFNGCEIWSIQQAKANIGFLIIKQIYMTHSEFIRVKLRRITKLL
jgi:hypothetical protein